MFTVKAFKPFEEIVETHETREVADQRYEELRRDPAIDAAYVFDANGILCDAWSDNYDEPDAEPESMAYLKSTVSGPLFGDEVDQRRFRAYAWIPNEDGKGSTLTPLGKFAPTGYKDVYDMGVWAHDADGERYDWVINAEMDCAAASEIAMLYNKLYDIGRWLVAVGKTMETDPHFASQTLHEIIKEIGNYTGNIYGL